MNDTADLPVPPPQRVLLKHREVLEAALNSRSRATGGGFWFSLILFGLLCLAIWAGHLLAFWLVQQLPFPVMFAAGPYVPVVVPAFLALVAVKLALDIEQARVARSYLAGLAAAGAPLEREGWYEVTAEALVLTTERMTLAPAWHAIDRVERGAKGWVLSGDQLHFLIPFADFATPEAERDLLAAITARMTAEARARSRDAVEFAAGEAVPIAREHAPPPAEPATADVAGATASGLPQPAGWLTNEQATWAANVIYARLARPGSHGWAYPLTGAVTGLVVGMVLTSILVVTVPENWLYRSPALATLFGLSVPLATGALGLAYAYRRLGIVLGKAWRSELNARGVPEQVEARWTLTETGLAYRTARFSGEAAYASLHQLLHESGYWIIAADTLTLCIPDTAFAAPGEAEGFMSALLARMSEPARERSVRLTA
jgi:hypothetical protein